MPASESTTAQKPADAKAQEQEEIAEKERREKEKQQKLQDEKRIRYICKEGDTLQSVASKQLKDVRFTGLIYEINKAVLPVQLVDGKPVAVMYAGLAIWLPSPRETREFRTKLMSSTKASVQS